LSFKDQKKNILTLNGPEKEFLEFPEKRLSDVIFPNVVQNPLYIPF